MRAQSPSKLRSAGNRIKFFAWGFLLGLRRWLGLDEALDKRQLLDGLKEERDQWRVILAQLDDSRMEDPGVQDDWSVKDILAHLAVWDRRGTRWIKIAAQGGMPEIPEPGLSRKDFDRLNYRSYLENRDKPLAEVMDEFNAAYLALIEQVEALPEGIARKPVMGKLISGRYKHSRKHRGYVLKWVGAPTSQET
jgi:hypothetical protein